MDDYGISKWAKTVLEKANALVDYGNAKLNSLSGYKKVYATVGYSLLSLIVLSIPGAIKILGVAMVLFLGYAYGRPSTCCTTEESTDE